MLIMFVPVILRITNNEPPAFFAFLWEERCNDRSWLVVFTLQVNVDYNWSSTREERKKKVESEVL